MDKDTTKTLIDYYKWIVSISSFLITSSIAIISIAPEKLCYKNILIIGVCLLGISIFFNIMIIKRLIVKGIINNKGKLTWIDRLHQASDENIKWYGLIQNGSFLFGTSLIVIYFILNLWK